MASSAKRRAVGVRQEPEESGSDSSEGSFDESGDSGEEDSNNSNEEINEEVIVDFEAHTISDNDFNGIRKLLQQLFLKANVDVSELTDIIIQQNHIGSVIRNDDVRMTGVVLLCCVFGQGVPCVEQVKELLLAQCEKVCPHSVVEELEKTLKDAGKPVGLLLSERFINVPPQIALPLHKQLQDEIAEAQKTNKPSSRCRYCLMISKTYMAEKKTGQKEELMFCNAEEEFFYEQATTKFNYSVQEEADSCLGGRWSFDDIPMKPFRTVMLIPSDRMGVVMDKLREYLTV
uniref:Protein BCCIP homolog n=1 Tax=Paramormyrops kingsleyae TaxID=1676925 RepID=A0A3B3RKA0_9TELE